MVVPITHIVNVAKYINLLVATAMGCQGSDQDDGLVMRRKIYQSNEILFGAKFKAPKETFFLPITVSYMIVLDNILQFFNRF